MRRIVCDTAGMSATLAQILVFVSSAAVLLLEILAGRLVAPYIGVTLETFTGIIGVVLLGIALGAMLGGRTADRLEPRPLIGPLLILGGLSSMAAPTVVDLVGPAMRSGGPVQIVLLTVSAFFLPALALSAIPPMVVKLRLRSLEDTGTVVGSLSALSTVGALVGTFVTGFVLVAAAPTRPLVLGAGALLIVGGIAMSAGVGSRGTRALALFATLAAALGLGFADSPCEFETTYFCAVIEVDPERPSGRTLRLDTLAHSYVDLADPTYLKMSYAQIVADVVEGSADGTLAAAYIGGGGFTLPRYFEAVRPGSTATVLEIDGALVRLVERELDLEQTDALHSEVGDARLLLPRYADQSFNLVVGDAFGGLSVPWHLTTREFMAEIDRVLTDDGVYVVNLIDYPPLAFARAEVATFRAVFANVAVIAPPRSLGGERGGNFVLVGSHRVLPWEQIQSRLERRTPAVVLWPDRFAEQFAGDSQVLRDDFAPVDQLLSQPPR